MSSVVGLELPNAWRTGQVNDSNFDISADQLNVTANREMWVPTSTIDWAVVRHTNAADPTLDQDLATKIYVDTNGGNLWSTFAAIQDVDMASNKIFNLTDPTNAQDGATKQYVDDNAAPSWSTFPATQDVDYVSLFKNINMIDPTLPQDSATKNYVDTQGFATDLDGLSDVTVTTPANNEVLQFNSGSGQWINQTISVPAGSIISQGDTSVEVIDTGVGLINMTVDNIIRAFFTPSVFDISVPIDMNSQQIEFLGTPNDPADAATKDYVDTEIANSGIKTDLNSLTDVTVAAAAANQVLVNNGAGQWVNQLLSNAQLPSTLAYENESNTFTSLNTFQAGITMAADTDLDLLGGFISQTKHLTLLEQGVNPPDPPLNEGTIFLDNGADFGSPDPLLEVLIDRGGVIEVKPIVTSETVFALRNFSNGMFTQETGTKISDAGSPNIRVQIFNENQIGQQFEVVLEGDIHLINDPDTTPGTDNSIDVSTGTDLLPTLHYIWIQLTLGVPVMTSNTTGFPTNIDLAVVGKFLFQSHADVLASGPYAVNSPDYEIFDDVSRGHLAHINDKLVEQSSAYLSGIDLTVVPAVGGGTLGNVTFSTLVGKAFELHVEDIEAFDSTTGLMFSTNEGTLNPNEFIQIADLGLDIVGKTCANGTTVIANNDRVNLVIFTVHNDNEPNQTNFAINFPQDVYGTDQEAIDDSSNFAIRTIGQSARGISLLIAEIVVKITGGATVFEVIAQTDLRGVFPGVAGGGTGAGSGGATQLDELSDVTIVTPLLDEGLVFNGAGQWVNKLTPQFETKNVWTNSQDIVGIADPLTGADDSVRLFTEVIDIDNTALFAWIRQDGVQVKMRIA